MNPEVGKLIAAITALVSTLNESAGIPSSGLPNREADTRFDGKKERVVAAPGLLVRLAEPALGDRTWEGIARIFAKSFESFSKKRPDYDEEAASLAVPPIIQQTAVVQEKTQGSFFEKLMKYLLPILALVGGIGLSIAALFQCAGPAGDLLNLIGKGLAKFGQFFLENMGKRIMSLSDNFLKVLGELSEGGLKLLGAGTLGIGKLFGGIASKIGKVLLKAAKFIPFLGSAVSFYFAYQKFQQGDYVGMGLEIASGILNLIPGFGWIASAIIDVITIARDLTTTKEERAEGGMGIVGKLFSGIGNWFKKNGMTILKSLPTIGSIIYFYEAYQAGFTTPEGIKKTITAFASILGGGSLIESAVNALFSLFDEKEEKVGEASPAATKGKSFFQIVKDFVINAVKKLPYYLRKPLEWLGIIKAADSEPGESWMSEGIEKSKEVGKKVLEKMSNLGGGIKDWFTGNLPKAKELGKNFLDKMSEFGMGIKDWFMGNLPKAKELGKDVLEKMSKLESEVSGWMGEKLAEGKEKGKEILSKITNAGREAAGATIEALTKIKNNIEKGISATKDILSPIINEMGEAANKIIEWVKGIFYWINNKVGKFASNLVDLFDFEPESEATKSRFVEQTLKNLYFNIQSPALDAIEYNTKQQVGILTEISNKIDKISISVPQPQGGTGPAGPTIPSGTGGVFSGTPRSQLFTVNNYSEPA